MIISISSEEYNLHHTKTYLRFLKEAQYPKDINSGTSVKEFVLLADRFKALGHNVIQHPELVKKLAAGEKVLKFGKTDIFDDINLLSRHKNFSSEWNPNNLEKIVYWNKYVNTERKLWNFCLAIDEHQAKLKELFAETGSIFIKTVTKGWSGIYHDFNSFLDSLGDLSSICEESKDIIASEIIEIKIIKASISGKTKMVTDEWRHHVYKNKLISSAHAFDCDEENTDDSGFNDNTKKAKQLIENLKEQGFSTYVVDTCTLKNGKIEVVELNNFFSSGIYGNSAINNIAQSISSID